MSMFNVPLDKLSTEIFIAEIGRWQKIDFRDLKRNDIFRIFPLSDGKSLLKDEDGNYNFRASKNAFVNKHNNGEIKYKSIGEHYDN